MLTYKTEGILYTMRFSLRASDGSASHISRQVYVFRFTTRQSIMDFYYQLFRVMELLSEPLCLLKKKLTSFYPI